MVHSQKYRPKKWTFLHTASLQQGDIGEGYQNDVRDLFIRLIQWPHLQF